MDSESEQTRDLSAATIEEELKNWPGSVHSQVAEAEAVSQATRQARTDRAIGRRRGIYVALTLLLLVALTTIPLLWYFNRDSATETAATAIPKPITEFHNAQLSVGPTRNGEYYKQTDGSLTSNGHEILKLVQYDFYASKFIVDNTALQNERALVATFVSLREQLKDSWLLVFASASVEGYEDYNLGLCRRRLYAVENLLGRDAGITARGYWGILAGEFKLDELDSVAPKDREDEENRIAKQRGELWLSNQRRLIIVTIRETTPLTPQAREQVPSIVAKYIFEQGMFPKEYDAPGSEPFPIISGDGINQKTPMK